MAAQATHILERTPANSPFQLCQHHHLSLGHFLAKNTYLLVQFAWPTYECLVCHIFREFMTVLFVEIGLPEKTRTRTTPERLTLTLINISANTEFAGKAAKRWYSTHFDILTEFIDSLCYFTKLFLPDFLERDIQNPYTVSIHLENSYSHQCLFKTDVILNKAIEVYKLV